MAAGTLALTGISCCITMSIMQACLPMAHALIGLLQQACWPRLEQVAILLCPLMLACMPRRSYAGGLPWLE